MVGTAIAALNQYLNRSPRTIEIDYSCCARLTGQGGGGQGQRGRPHPYDPESAVSVIDALDGAAVNGRQITVNEARPE